MNTNNRRVDQVRRGRQGSSPFQPFSRRVAAIVRAAFRAPRTPMNSGATEECRRLWRLGNDQGAEVLRRPRCTSTDTRIIPLGNQDGGPHPGHTGPRPRSGNPRSGRPAQRSRTARLPTTASRLTRAVEQVRAPWGGGEQAPVGVEAGLLGTGRGVGRMFSLSLQRVLTTETGAQPRSSARAATQPAAEQFAALICPRGCGSKRSRPRGNSPRACWGWRGVRSRHGSSRWRALTNAWAAPRQCRVSGNGQEVEHSWLAQPESSLRRWHRFPSVTDLTLNSPALGSPQRV